MIVLDSCAAVDIVRETTEGKALSSLMLTGEKVISSDLFYAEITNAFWQYCKAGFYGEGEAANNIEKAIQLVDEFFPLDEFCKEAFSESVRLDHSSYDMLYFILARRNGATLFTLDRKLQRLCLNNGVNCVFADTEF